MSALAAEKSELTVNDQPCFYYLDRCPVMRLLPEDMRKQIAEESVYRKLEAGEVLYTIGQYDVFECYLIVEGSLKTTYACQNTGELKIKNSTVGDLIGFDLGIADQQKIAARMGLETDDACTLICIETEQLVNAFLGHEDNMKSLIHYYAQQSVNEFSKELQGAVASKRVYTVLAGLAENDPADPGVWSIPEMPKHRELAELCGVTDVEAAEAVAMILRQDIAERAYPGLLIKNFDELKNMSM